MEAQIATYGLAITIATGLLFGISRMIDSLEKRLAQLLDEVRGQHAEKTHLKPSETITLFRQLSYLDRRQSRVEWMGRILGFGYVTGYIFGAAGLLLLLLGHDIDWLETTSHIATAIISYLALTSIIGNLFIMLGVSQACRRGMKEARIAPLRDMNNTSQ